MKAADAAASLAGGGGAADALGNLKPLAADAAADAAPGNLKAPPASGRHAFFSTGPPTDIASAGAGAPKLGGPGQLPARVPSSLSSAGGDDHNLLAKARPLTQTQTACRLRLRISRGCSLELGFRQLSLKAAPQTAFPAAAAAASLSDLHWHPP